MTLANMNLRGDYDSMDVSAPDNRPCVYLNEAQCAALGMGAVAAGTKVKFSGIATLTRVTQSVDGDADDPDVCATLSIDAMDLGSASSGSALYEDSGS